jgi:hypothetical protein
VLKNEVSSMNDFFISYKWNKYSFKAKELKAIVEKKGFTVWLDVDHPFQESQNQSKKSDEALSRHLREAMDS